MLTSLNAIFLLSILGSICGLFSKNLRSKALWLALASFIGLITSSIISGEALNESARQRGFLSSADLQHAESAGIADAAAWQIEKEKAKTAEIADAAARQMEKEKAKTAEIAAVEVKRVAVARAETRRAELLRQPQEQAKFIRAIERGREQFENGQNDLQRGAARPYRAKQICSALPGSQVTGWIGTVANLSTNGDGNGVVAIKIAHKLHLMTWNNSFSDFGADTLIKAGSPAYQALLNMKVGDWVRFHGKMFSSGQDCHRETSLTLAGSLDAPTFLVRFSKIDRVELP